MAADETESPLTTIAATKRGREAKGQRAEAGGAVPSETALIDAFDLITHARKHRYRIRNLHDGGSVPPARRMKAKGEVPVAQSGYVGREDRHDTIVGYDGYLSDEGDGGQLSVYLCYKSARGVVRAEQRLKAMGGTVEQIGDAEISGTVPVGQIDEALKLIRASKLKPGRPGFGQSAPAQSAYAS